MTGKTSRILAIVLLFSAIAYGGVVFSVTVGPPPIAVFDQPPCPGDGYIWTPGYYQYGDYGWYWVPGAWVLPPTAGVLWTPGYWGFEGGRYLWHAGYWGPKVGFYGGINYGNGYFGSGFTGGRWVGNVFHHNTVVSNVDVNRVKNVYVDKTVVRNVNVPSHAFNGQGGITTRPTHEEEEYGRATTHQGPTPAQVAHAQEAHNNHLAAHGARGR